MDMQETWKKNNNNQGLKKFKVHTFREEPLSDVLALSTFEEIMNTSYWVLNFHLPLRNKYGRGKCKPFYVQATM